MTADARALAGLSRLRALREDAARRSLAQAQTELERCRQAVQRRAAQVAAVRAKRRTLFEWLAGEGAATLPRLAPVARARCEALDEELERAEVALVDDRDALQRAERTLLAARAAWLQAHRRREALDTLGREQARADARERDRRAEAETDPMVLITLGSR